MSLQILWEKPTLGQYLQIVEFGMLTDHQQFLCRGGVFPPSETSPATQFRIPVMHQQMYWVVDRQFPALGEKTSPLRWIRCNVMVLANSLHWVRRPHPYGL